MDEDPLPLGDAVAELAEIRLGEGELEDVLRRVSEVTVRAVAGADAVSVTLYQDEVARTAATTGGFAVPLDEKQYQLGGGPCVDAAISGQTIVVEDLETDRRWAVYAAAAVAAGVRGMLAVALSVQHPAQGGLNLYSARPRAFDAEAQKVAVTFAGYAAVAVANAQLYADTATYAEQMRQALESRAVIDQAKGIIMRDQGCTAEEAFDVLRGVSMHTNRKLRDIALATVESVRTIRP